MTTEMRNRRPMLSNITSGVALSVSVFALALGAWQTRLMQSQARASVWPYLSIGYTFNSDTDQNAFIWRIDNNGVGPARVQRVSLTLDGRPMKHWTEVLIALGFKGKLHLSTSSAAGEVIPPSLNRETAIEAIHINDRDVGTAFKNAVERFKMDICYCSVYDDCWIAHWQMSKVDPVERCDAPGETSFQD
ncbi:MAG TPA: hypothetical protein VGO25_11135 [Rhodanobacteraceae bacterium]|nr:hypothetical protein [Rhodanobacteraceae bacterium]